MAVTGIINPPNEVSALSNLMISVRGLTSFITFNSMSFQPIVFGPVSRFLLTPTQVVAGFTTNYYVSVSVFQPPRVNDRIVISFPEGTTRLLNNPVAVTLESSTSMTFKDCMVNEISPPEVRCRVQSVTSDVKTDTILTYFVQNLRHGLNSTLAMLTPLRYLVLPPDNDITTTTIRRDANFTGALTLRLADPCKPGEYSPNFNGTCFKCPKGNVSTIENALSCTPCSAGRFAKEEGMTQCEDCDIGRYQNLTGQSDCIDCRKGKFAAIKMRTICEDCEPGTDLNMEKGTKCNDCPLNTFAPGNGTEMCQTCPTGTATNDTRSISCDFCVGGRYFNTSTGKCEFCAKGKFTGGLNNRNTCQDCDIGWVSGEGAIQCSQCQAGKIAPFQGTPECIDCEPGKAVGAPGQGKCDDCNQGFEAPDPGMMICSECTAGKFSKGGAIRCELCPKGSVAEHPRAFQCDICNTGEYMDEPGQSTCLPCTAGKFQNMTNSTGCMDCGLGTFSRGSRASICTACDPGYYQNRTGQNQCELCEPGLKSPEPGNVQCRYIPDGCEPGRYTVFNETTGNDTCIACPTGKFNDDYNKTICDDCPLGRYQPDMEQIFCYNCTAGNYTPRTGMPYCDLCPLGRYSTQNESYICTECMPGQSTPTAGMTRCDNCPAGTIAPVIASPICIECQKGKYNPVNGSTTCHNCPLSTSTPSTGTIKLSSCQSVTCNPITTDDPNLQITYSPPQTIKTLFGPNTPPASSNDKQREGSAAHFSCANGYVIVGPATRTCLAPIPRPTFTADTGASGGSTSSSSGSSSPPSDVPEGFWTGSNPSCVLPSSFNLTAIPTGLVFNVNPLSSVRAGEAWTNYIEVVLVDAEGAPTPAASALVTLSLDSSRATNIITPTGPVTSTSSETSVAGSVRLLGNLVRETVNGVAVFPGLSLNAIGEDFRLLATANISASRGNSIYFKAVPNEATRLSISTPIRCIANELFTADVTVTVTDSVGYARNHTTNITLGIVENDFWMVSGGPGSTLTTLTTSGSITFTGLRVATSRVLGAGSGFFHFYATAPELEKGYSVRVQLFSSVANNQIRRMQEFVYPLVFNMTLKTTEAVYRGEKVHRDQFISSLTLDLCTALKLTTSGCKRIRVTYLTPTNQTSSTSLELLGSTGNSRSYSVDTTHSIIATIQIDPPTGLTTTTVNRMVVAGGRPLSPSPSPSPSSSSLFSVSDAELLAISSSSTSCYNGKCSIISPQLLASTTADAATPYELIAQATSLLNTPSSSIFQGAVSSQAVLSSATLDITGRLVLPTEESMRPDDSGGDATPLIESDNFIIGMTLGLGLGGILVIIGIIYYCTRSKEEKSVSTEMEDLRPAQTRINKPVVKRAPHPSSATMSKYSTSKPKADTNRSKLAPSSSFNV